MDVPRVDQIVQFALARAAQEQDWRVRQLGPIHLLKYVYLADLAHARTHDGATYTGIAWTFYHYGPWSPEVFERLEPAALAIGANVSTIASAKYDKDFTRFELNSGDADSVERALDRELPSEVASAVKFAVRKFGNDTPGLLDWVYRTPPMLAAAPRERLDFSVARVEAPKKEAPPVELKRKQEKKLEAAVAAAQQAFKERRAKLKATAPTPARSAAPRYDEVFAAGAAWLDALGAVEPLEGEVHFPDDIWKSGWRDPHGE